MPTTVPASCQTVFAPSAALRPSEYTAALIQVLRARGARLRGTAVLEIGSGSGVVLAALATLGVASLCGIDIEEEAVVEGSSLLRSLGFANIAQFERGDMWLPVAGRRFDLIAANLPHFPMQSVEVKERLPSWSCGGSDGRHLLNPFLDGLAAHLAPGGHALITHNAFVSLELSRSMLQQHGLSLRIAQTYLVYIPGEKLELLTPSVLGAEEGRSIYRYGHYAFADMHIVEISVAETMA